MFNKIANHIHRRSRRPIGRAAEGKRPHAFAITSPNRRRRSVALCIATTAADQARRWHRERLRPHVPRHRTIAFGRATAWQGRGSLMWPLKYIRITMVSAQPELACRPTPTCQTPNRGARNSHRTYARAKSMILLGRRRAANILISAAADCGPSGE